jgi:hypothetical protein
VDRHGHCVEERLRRLERLPDRGAAPLSRLCLDPYVASFEARHVMLDAPLHSSAVVAPSAPHLPLAPPCPPVMHAQLQLQVLRPNVLYFAVSQGDIGLGKCGTNHPQVPEPYSAPSPAPHANPSRGISMLLCLSPLTPSSRSLPLYLSHPPYPLPSTRPWHLHPRRCRYFAAPIPPLSLTPSPRAHARSNAVGRSSRWRAADTATSPCP